MHSWSGVPGLGLGLGSTGPGPVVPMLTVSNGEAVPGVKTVPVLSSAAPGWQSML